MPLIATSADYIRINWRSQGLAGARGHPDPTNRPSVNQRSCLTITFVSVLVSITTAALLYYAFEPGASGASRTMICVLITAILILTLVILVFYGRRLKRAGSRIATANTLQEPSTTRPSNDSRNEQEWPLIHSISTVPMGQVVYYVENLGDIRFHTNNKPDLPPSYYEVMVTATPPNYHTVCASTSSTTEH